MNWPLVPFADIVQARGSGASGLPQSEWTEDGRFPVIGQGAGLIEGWSDREDLVLNPEPAVVLYGGHTRRAKYVDRPFVPGPNVKILVPQDKLEPKFLFYYLAQLRIVSRGYADHFPEVRRCAVPLPPLSEQRRIIEILDKAEALRSKRRETIAKLDVLLRSVFLDMFGDPVVNSMGWPKCTVGELTTCIVPGRDKPRSFTGEIPWITTDDLEPLSVTLESKKGLGLTVPECDAVRAKVIPKGSVLMSCVGELGITSIAGVDMVVNQQLHSYQCGDRITPEFLMHCISFQTLYMKSRSSSTTIPYMNKSVCSGIPIVVPPFREQQAFVEFCLSHTNQVLNETRSAVALDALFVSMQQDAFSRNDYVPVSAP